MILTKEERNAIATLKRLAKRWPETLWLFSASGSLEVMKKKPDGLPAYIQTGNGESVDQAYVVATIDIENDGGDW